MTTEAIKNNQHSGKQQAFRDPRPDLGADSILWAMLLEHAYKIDRLLGGTLHGFRCQGTVLRKSPRWGYVLQPVINRERGWPSREDYDTQRSRWLDPYRQDIIRILRKL